MLASVFAPLHGSISFGENIGCGHLTFPLRFQDVDGIGRLGHEVGLVFLLIDPRSAAIPQQRIGHRFTMTEKEMTV